MYQNGCTFSYNSIRLIFLQNIFKKIPDAVLFILQNFYQESFLHEFHIHCFHNRLFRMRGKNKESMAVESIIIA